MTQFGNMKEKECFRFFMRIACAIICQTSKDLGFVKNPSYAAPKSRGDKRSARACAEALEWVNDEDSVGVFSLKNCCGYINDCIEVFELGVPLVSPEIIRNAILNRLKDLSHLVEAMREVADDHEVFPVHCLLPEDRIFDLAYEDLFIGEAS